MEWRRTDVLVVSLGSLFIRFPRAQSAADGDHVLVKVTERYTLELGDGLGVVVDLTWETSE